MTAFVDGVNAYTVTRDEEYDGWIVVAVNSEEQGYRHMNPYTIYFKEEVARQVADELNHRMGIYEDEELAVTACSMFPGARYEDELQKLRDRRRPARP